MGSRSALRYRGLWGGACAGDPSLWAYSGAGSEGCIAALLYAVTCALWLALFNIGSRAPAPEAPLRKTFTGVPSPAEAMLTLLPIFMANLVLGALLPAPLCGESCPAMLGMAVGWVRSTSTMIRLRVSQGLAGEHPTASQAPSPDHANFLCR